MKKICGMYNVGVMTLPQLLDIELCDVNYSVIFHIVAFQAWQNDVNKISWMTKCSTDDLTVFPTDTIKMVHLVHLLLIGVCLQVNISHKYKTPTINIL